MIRQPRVSSPTCLDGTTERDFGRILICWTAFRGSTRQAGNRARQVSIVKLFKCRRAAPWCSHEKLIWLHKSTPVNPGHPVSSEIYMALSPLPYPIGGTMQRSPLILHDDGRYDKVYPEQCEGVGAICRRSQDVRQQRGLRLDTDWRSHYGIEGLASSSARQELCVRHGTRRRR